jgi:hypothetical protein
MENMEELIKLIGHEYTVKKISRTLCETAEKLRPGIVGAMHVTCADESEHECVQAFQKGFVQHHLPELKFAQQSAFRISNLGGRYDWGAFGIAEEHFVLPRDQKSFKLMVAKVNSHVGVISETDREYYGYYKRYGMNSACCGALNSLMAGKQGPFLDELRELFRSGGKERLQILMNAGQVTPELRGLYAAVVSAVLQARRVMADIRKHTASAPTLYLVVPCVTLNRSDIDTEILCGVYTADHRSGSAREEYTGPGDDPSTYSLEIRNRRIFIADSSRQQATRSGIYKSL